MERDSLHVTKSRQGWQKKARFQRRLRSRKPLSARLLLDHRIKGDTGVLSDDLILDLFPHVNATEPETFSDTLYVAVSPWIPNLSAVEDLSWTIIPVRPQPSDKRKDPASISQSTAHFPASGNSIQSFLHALQAVDPSRNSLLAPRGIEIYILDVTPLHLDTVYVTVERNLLRDIDEVQSRFGGGFNVANESRAKGKGGLTVPALAKKRGKEAQTEREDRLMAAVREALSTQNILHTGDILPLPLPPHPITHTPAPPARVSLCEPVSQGFLVPRTKVVLIQMRSQQKSRITRGLSAQRSSLLKQVVVEDEADDNNEQFYSAGEDKPIESGTDIESTTPTDESDTDASVQSSSEMSDDSLDDMISLAAPELPHQPSGIMSVLSSTTPRPGGKRFDVQTPRSVLSGFTSGTARQRRYGGKIFRADCLLDRISNEILHPRPRDDDDTDAFVFVDVHSLVKIGCFSGDWIRIEASEEPQRNMLASLKFGNLNELGEAGESDNWRIARVYGIPGLSPPKIRYSMNHDGRSNISHMPPRSLTPTVLVPPILLYNMQSPKYLKLSSLTGQMQHQSHAIPRPGLGQPKSTLTKSPPVAKEVTLSKISTPLSTDRTLQPTLFGALKRHFEAKRRLVKSGDIVGISVDEGLGKTVFSASRASESANQDDELATQLGFPFDCSDRSPCGVKKTGVAWFRVSHVISPNVETDDLLDGEIWGGVAVIDCLNTRMVQAGSEISTVPKTLGNTWEYWLGVKALPPSNPGQGGARRAFIESPPKQYISQTQRRVRELIAAATSPRAIQLGMKPVVILLTSTQRNIGKSTVARSACADIGLHTFAINAYDILAEGGASGGDVKTEAYFKARADRAFACGADCTTLLIQHIEVLTADRMVTAMKDVIADARAIIATTTDVEKIPEGIRSLFTHELELTAPDEKEREGILQNAVIDLGVRLSADVDLSAVALKTAALVAGDLVDVVERAIAARNLRLEKLAENSVSGPRVSPISITDIQISGGDVARCVTKVDFDAAVDAARKNFADSIGAPKIPNVTWDDVGGLSNVKDAVMETIQLPLERPELFVRGMKKRSGILFYGPPGTGKTLLAKAIATEFSLNFFSVKGPELLNMYIGESEANVRRVFQRARDARPCVVFFDELDSVAPKRGNQGDSGGVMDRIVSQLLAELDGMSSGDENGGGVFVIGATNRPDLLDAALLRPGRFDKMLYLGVSDTHAKQTTILEALTRRFKLHPDVSLERVAEQLPFTYTGADLYALCSDAMLKAITRQASAVDEKIKELPGGPVSTAYFFDHFATPNDVAVMVTEKDFIAAQQELVPSVSARELEHFERIRHTFESVDTAKRSDKQQGKRALMNGSVEVVRPNGAIAEEPDHQLDRKAGVPSDDEDEYVFRTDHLSIPMEKDDLPPSDDSK
ncbi:peroxisomal assembly protein [Emydomyces testavorans]|uniref:Peroxisomal ATPase PEX6 n=1 Tax=Emydomyces testavorans TaxID=2070801 RepID=A0AAF0IJ57_9EURO|nr:peroxisomal assembly protein [Emydomyces testavorans]